MSNLIILQGIQASGKTTYAIEYCKEHPNTIRLNRDDIRSMFNCKWSRELENIVKNTEYFAMKDAFLRGFDVILDDVSNLNDQTLELINDILKDIEPTVSVSYKRFYVTLEECIHRDSLREHPIGEKVIKDTYRRYNAKLSSMKNQEQLEKFQSQDAKLPHCIIVDIDNTISWNVTGRPWYGEGASEGMKKDVPITPVIDMIKRYPYHVIYLTGRDNAEDVKNVTINWIKENARLNDGDLILFRENGDHSSGDVVKESLYNNHINGKYFVDYILEDSDKIVKMYREKGLIVLQPYNTSYC